MAATPSPMTTSRHHQPSRVGQMVRRGRKGRHHHSLSLQVRFGTHLMAPSGSARNGYVLDDRSEDGLAVHAAALRRAALEEDPVRESGDGQALHVVGHEVVAAVDEGMRAGRAQERQRSAWAHPQREQRGDAGGLDEGHEVVEHGLLRPHALGLLLERQHLASIQHGHERLEAGRAGAAQHGLLVEGARIADPDSQEKAVELRLGQGIRALLVGSQMLTPITSEGSMSEVNWMRWKPAPMERARAAASVVLPTPGTSSMRMWPRASRPTTASRTASGLPTRARLTLASSLRMRSSEWDMDFHHITEPPPAKLPTARLRGGPGPWCVGDLPAPNRVVAGNGLSLTGRGAFSRNGSPATRRANPRAAFICRPTLRALHPRPGPG